MDCEISGVPVTIDQSDEHFLAIVFPVATLQTKAPDIYRVPFGNSALHEGLKDFKELRFGSLVALEKRLHKSDHVIRRRHKRQVSGRNTKIRC